MDNSLFLPRSLVAAVSDTGFALATGCALCAFWLRESSEQRRRLSDAALLALAAILVMLPLQLLLATAVMTGTTEWSAVRGQASAVALHTHAGEALLAQGLAVLPAAAALWLGRRARGRTAAAVLLLLPLAACRAATGHAAGDGDFTLAETMQLVHLGATAAWAGGVMAVAWLGAPRLSTSGDAGAVRRLGGQLSTTATAALGLILLSGGYNSWRGLDGKAAPLLHTQWGLLLCAKLALVAVAVTLGAMNRGLLRRPEFGPQEARLLQRTLRVEAVAMAGILLLSALLANSPPAAAQ